MSEHEAGNASCGACQPKFPIPCPCGGLIHAGRGRVVFARCDKGCDIRDLPGPSCPCAWTTPCDPHCTCVTPHSSRGCARCCSYGSPEQRKARAEALANLSTELAATRAKNAELNRRAQQAEKAARDTLERAQRSDGSIGRALANWAAKDALRQRDAYRAALERIRSKLTYGSKNRLYCAECDREIKDGVCDGAGCPFAVLSVG